MREVLVVGETWTDADAVHEVLKAGFNAARLVRTIGGITFTVVEANGVRVWIHSASTSNMCIAASQALGALDRREMACVLVGTRRSMPCDIAVATNHPCAPLTSTAWHSFAAELYTPEQCQKQMFLRYIYCRAFPGRPGSKEWLSSNQLPLDGPILGPSVQGCFEKNAEHEAVRDGSVFEDDEGFLFPTDKTTAAIEEALAHGEEYPAKPVVPGTVVGESHDAADNFLQVVTTGYVVRARFGDEQYQNYARHAAAAYALQWLGIF